MRAVKAVQGVFSSSLNPQSSETRPQDSCGDLVTIDSRDFAEAALVVTPRQTLVQAREALKTLVGIYISKLLTRTADSVAAGPIPLDEVQSPFCLTLAKVWEEPTNPIDYRKARNVDGQKKQRERYQESIQKESRALVASHLNLVSAPPRKL
jgi:hypothetical protein